MGKVLIDNHFENKIKDKLDQQKAEIEEDMNQLKADLEKKLDRQKADLKGHIGLACPTSRLAVQKGGAEEGV